MVEKQIAKNQPKQGCRLGLQGIFNSILRDLPLSLAESVTILLNGLQAHQVSLA